VSVRAFALGLGGIVVLAVALAVLVLESPAQARARRLDEQRTRDLDRIADLTDSYWTREQEMPPDLETLGRELRVAPFPSDPESRAAYGYRVTGPRSYELCARFALASDPDEPLDVWRHPAGDHCFAFEAGSTK
jgi:hypothetical protein